MTDKKDIILKGDESVNIRIGGIILTIKHNDVGLSIDHYIEKDNVLVKEQQEWFDDYTNNL